jgi:hypothetical protein
MAPVKSMLAAAGLTRLEYINPRAVRDERRPEGREI